jgi:predicted phosphodiesterase
MKILTLSDLHLELSNFKSPQVDVDVVVLPGDIHKSNLGIYWARETWPDKPIVFVAGNHEFYKYDRVNVLDNLRIAAKEMNVHFLDNEEVIIEGVRFLGCTLWTDFCLFGKDKQTVCMNIARERLSDFAVIHDHGELFTPEHSILLHRQSLEWLESKLLNESFNGKTVVVTHHCPSRESVAPKYQSDLLSACFASRLDHLMGKSELWIHGHTHESFDYELKVTRVVCNPRGYVLRNSVENPSFDESKIVTCIQVK